MKISSIHGREILDSKGEPTVETTVVLQNGMSSKGAVPSGASTGEAEALELRDNDASRYLGKGVLKAVQNVNQIIAPAFIDMSIEDQSKVDQTLIDLDGTQNKSKLGANATLSVSMAICKAAAKAQKIPLYKHFAQLTDNTEYDLPQPQMLILEGGKHGNWSTDIQEYMIIPKRSAFDTFAKRLQVGTQIYHQLGQILKEKNYSVGVGMEGAFMPKEIQSNQEAFELIESAIEKSGYQPNEQIVIGIDAASSEFYQDNQYCLKSENGKTLNPADWSKQIQDWLKTYPIWSVEDIFAQEDWESWSNFMAQIKDHTQVVGDDLFTTSLSRIQKGIDLRAANCVIIKPNQIGTITETLKAIKLADQAGWSTIISHRAGETNDDLIADLVVGTTSWQCKFGAPIRGERLAKYNRLLQIEQELQNE